MEKHTPVVPLVSVIVPVYKVEKYLDQCVRSLLSQTMKDIEILLIDDGSPDGCGAMCDAYAAADTRVRVIHKPNGGLSDARNVGIEAAKADYVGFVDSDDYVDSDMYESLYTMLQREKADVAVCGIYHCYTNEIRKAPDITSHYVVDAKEIIRMMLDSSKISVNAVNKLYRKELFREIRFPVGKQSEDAHIMIRLMAQIQKGVVDLAPKYYYVHREGSITTHSYRPADLSVIEAYENNLKFVKEHYPTALTEAEFRYFWAHFYVLDKIVFSQDPAHFAKKREIIRLLKKNAGRILKNPCFGKGRKVSMLALLFHESMYRRCVELYDKKKRALFA